MKAGVSLVLLDSSGSKLVHSASWGLPLYYLRKGMPDADKSLTEVKTGETVVIEDVKQDSRIQYSQMATQAGIVSIIGAPVIQDGKILGSVRVYTKQRCECSRQDINFVITMANLTAADLQAAPSDTACGKDAALETGAIHNIRPSQ